MSSHHSQTPPTDPNPASAPSSPSALPYPPYSTPHSTLIIATQHKQNTRRTYSPKQPPLHFQKINFFACLIFKYSPPPKTKSTASKINGCLSNRFPITQESPDHPNLPLSPSPSPFIFIPYEFLIPVPTTQNAKKHQQPPPLHMPNTSKNPGPRTATQRASPSGEKIASSKRDEGYT